MAACKQRLCNVGSGRVTIYIEEPQTSQCSSVASECKIWQELRAVNEESMLNKFISLAGCNACMAHDCRHGMYEIMHAIHR